MAERNGRAQKKCVLLMMYLLFAAFAVGSIAASVAVGRCEGALPLGANHVRDIQTTVISCVVYYGAVMLFGRFPIGTVLIPIVLLIRGFAFTAGMSVIAHNGSPLLQAAAPTFLQLPALFYGGAVSMCMAAGFERGNHICKRQYKRGVLLCGASTAASCCAVFIL